MPADPIVPLACPTGEELDRVEREMLEAGSSEDPLDWLAFMFFSHDRWEKARDYYAKLVARIPTNGSYHYYLAESLCKLGGLDTARGHFERVVSLDLEGHYARLARSRLEAADRGGA
jgi:tetratricopeptide (TPR) repeat protein